MADAPFQVTREWIFAWRTPRGAWTRAQLAVLGLPWPPRQGWVRRVHGLTLSASQRADFEREGLDRHDGGGSRCAWCGERFAPDALVEVVALGPVHRAGCPSWLSSSSS
jgi:hypothetical protein